MVVGVVAAAVAGPAAGVVEEERMDAGCVVEEAEVVEVVERRSNKSCCKIIHGRLRLVRAAWVLWWVWWCSCR